MSERERKRAMKNKGGCAEMKNDKGRCEGDLFVEQLLKTEDGDGDGKAEGRKWSE